ncbi:MAG: dephospho-CoA kinase [Synechococcus sp. MED650]|nr:dephospho-CoA kinase [Synechococcus sp. MED650]
MSPGERSQQRRIGLTGGIASGKSSVGRWLAQQGLPVLDADQFAREALAPGSEATTAVLQRYGETVCQGNATAINRAALGQIVFNDNAERRWLEQLIHPLVRQRFDEALRFHAGESTVVLMIPLLFEAGLEGLCSEIWLVDCDPEQQRERLMARDGLSRDAAQARMAAQWPLSRKRPMADLVIQNRSTPNAWIAEVQQALS